MKSKVKKLIVLAMTTVMLFATTLTVNAAYCNHTPTSSTHYKYSTVGGQCGHAMGCQFITKYFETITKCTSCGTILNVSEFSTVSHSQPF